MPRISVRPYALAATLAALGFAAACSDNTAPVTPPVTPPAPTGPVAAKINHVVVIYLENHSFDNLYGEFTAANGIANAKGVAPNQVSLTGSEFATLPQVAGSPVPTNLPNRPFAIEQYVAPTVATRDLVHRYYQEQQQIDGGKMDKFVAVSDAQGLSLGYYHTAGLPLTAEARKYVLCDNFFHSAFGGSFLNHIFFIAAAPPVFPNAPAGITATVDASGNMLTDGQVTPDGYAVNTSFTVNAPHPATIPAANLVPNQTMPTIGDRLNDASVSWAWYAGGWNDALAGTPNALYQFHHQPFAYFANYADGTPGKAAHLKDETEFFAAAAAGTLPAVSFIKPVGANNEHPGYTDLMTGEKYVVELINAVRNGPNWKDAAIFITYDEHGGFWDHVAPPAIDKWGPGSRVPAIIISPYTKPAFIDHTQYETVSILSFIEARWSLPALTDRDKKANPMLGAFDFTQTPVFSRR